MAVISETLQIQDKFSAAFGQFNTLGERVAQTLEHIDKNLSDYVARTDEAVAKTQGNEAAVKSADVSMKSFAGTIARVAAALGGMAAIKGAISLSDDLSLMTTRLNNVNDGLQTTGELYDMIFQSAQRARGSFTDMAQTVSSLKAQTGDTFSSVKEAVAFTELLNKQFKIAGTDATGISSTMYNLTQALSTGTLKGQDLNTVFANAPQLVKRIADYMGQPVGKMKDLAAEGKITADIVKNAILGAADDIDAQFASMPMTFADAVQKVRNIAIVAFQPIGEKIAGLIASPEFDAAIQQVASGLLTVANIGFKGFEMLARAAGFVKDNLSTIGPIVGIIVGAFLAYNAVMGIAAAVTTAHGIASGIAATAQAIYAAAAGAAATGQSAFNAALAACPITWIVVAIIAAIAVVVALIVWFHNLADTGHTIFGDIAGTALGAFNVIKNALAVIANAFISAAEFIVNAWNTGVYNIQMAIYNFAIGAATQFNGVIDAADGAATAIANAFIAGANKAIQGINWLIDAINKIPGVDIGKMGEIGQVDSVISKRIDVGAIKAPTKAEAVSFGRFSTTSIGDAFSEGFEKGAKKGDAAQNGLTNAIKGLKADVGDLMGGGSIGDLIDSNALAAGAGGAGGAGGKGNVGSVDKVKKVEDVKLSDEDIKVYRDLAERRYMANVELQTLAPEIHVSIPESAAQNLTSKDIADKLKVMLIEQASAHTAVAHAH
ncbi:MAG: tape measure protein [Oscillospiraceae bacterium]|nr:tape measure protein [Oscillospiraceae bacterium]